MSARNVRKKKCHPQDMSAKKRKKECSPQKLLYTFLVDICCGGDLFLCFMRTYFVADIRFFADISCGGHSFLHFSRIYVVAAIVFKYFCEHILWQIFLFAFLPTYVVADIPVHGGYNWPNRPNI